MFALLVESKLLMESLSFAHMSVGRSSKRPHLAALHSRVSCMTLSLGGRERGG